MCGIFYYETIGVGSKNRIPMHKLNSLQTNFAKIAHRGPDNSRFIVKDQSCIGFHRLAINGLASTGDQPFFLLGCELICNGEIYNHAALVQKYGFSDACVSGSDCEVIIHLYRMFNGDMQATLKELDGVFSLVLIDRMNNIVHIARDPFGVRSLYIGTSSEYERDISVASEMKALHHCAHVEQFPGGCYMTVSKFAADTADAKFETKLAPYYTDLRLDETLDVPYVYNFGTFAPTYLDDANPSPEKLEFHACTLLRNLFELAVCKRLMSERPVGCLLSGGLDSSITTALVVKHMAQANAQAPGTMVNTYAVGLEGSVDLKWARRVAEHLGTRHHEVCLTEQQFLEAIDATIYQIESYDTTTVRASVGNYLISKHIYNNTDNVVIFCGDMSDEIFGSYRGFTKAPSDHAFGGENVRMVRDVRYFDLLRSDKSISGAGLEARVPFADKTFLEFVMSLPPWMKRFGEGADYAVEKHLLRKAFDGLLPDDVLWRRKEAFSDGVSGHERTWVQIIKEHVDKRVSDVEVSIANDLHKFMHNAPYDKESYYYRTVFERHFPGKGRAETIPYFWRHPFCEGVLDPSARLLKDVYAAENQG
jgi:asparagine synthase (glutamine-hydrolysing)